MQNGNLLIQLRSYGLRENVSLSSSYAYLKLVIMAFIAGAGKSVIWCDDLLLIVVFASL
jgi:hypothetical protein